MASEPASRREDSQPKMPADRTAIWLASPLILAFVGLIGTGVGAVLQGFWNTKLEREKFEFSLIQGALATTDKKAAAQNLKFLAEVGLITQFDAGKISTAADKPDELPIFLGTAVRDQLIKVRDAKAVLAHLGLYQGPINDDADAAYRKAVADFQTSRGMPPDGLIGPMTFAQLREAWPDYFRTK